MPIYEYRCAACHREFELLVRGAQVPACECGATDLERLFSLPNVSSTGTRAQALRAAQQRDQKLGTERAQAQLNYERSHND